MEKHTQFDELMTCPLNKAHKVLRGRLAKHLDRCMRNCLDINKFKICPFNKTHRYSVEDMAAHIKECPDACLIKTFGSFTMESSDKAVPRPLLCKSDENWDEEPDVPSYDPSTHCEENNIIRTNGLKGQSKAAREKFRASERRRFAEKQ
ncbi:gametocyte-specific factor 1 homolog [Drosophila innubila]|uniref:gametocyte-specific factor 1 homolog n=1 Tax=Drosophila innubila TaxID=198719 RepID=UPI00148D731C|nr:gametocyte-specific factor 1 homolog [Drosophila innubila]